MHKKFERTIIIFQYYYINELQRQINRDNNHNWSQTILTLDKCPMGVCILTYTYISYGNCGQVKKQIHIIDRIMTT